MNKNKTSLISFIGVVFVLLILGTLRHDGRPNLRSETSNLNEPNAVEPYLLPRAGATPVVLRRNPASSSWSEVIPELDVHSTSNQVSNFKRTYSILQRMISSESARRSELNYLRGKNLKEIQTAIGLNQADTELFYNRSNPEDSSGVSTTRLGVTKNGIPVFGSEVIINHFSNQEGVREEIVADVIKEVSSNLEAHPSIPEKEALKSSVADALESAGVTDLKTQLLSSKLVYYPTATDLTLAWQLRLRTEAYQGRDGIQAHGVWNYFVDTNSAEILGKFNEVHTAEAVQASGTGGNEKFNRSWVNELDVTPQGKSWIASTNQIATVDFNGNTTGSLSPIVGTNLNNFGIRDGNNAHGYAELTLKFLSDLGYNSVDEKGLVIVSVVRYAVGYANAFWDGTYNVMVYGDGGSFFYNMASDPAVVAHEINHGFTQFHSNLIYDQQSGGLNEAFSDIAGATATYSNNQPGASFLIGDKIIRAGGFLRDMCNPTADGFSIDNLKNYTSKIDVHYSSGIANKAFCRFARRLASSGDPTKPETRESVIKAAKVFFRANKTKWTMNSTFLTAATGTQEAANDLGYTASEKKYLVDSWADVGVVIATPPANAPPPTIRISNMKTGSVKVRTGGAEFTCDSNSGICSRTSVFGEIVNFEIVSTNDSLRVTNISGCDKRHNGICEVVADKDREIIPVFETAVCPPHQMLKGGACHKTGISRLKFE